MRKNLSGLGFVIATTLWLGGIAQGEVTPVPKVPLEPEPYRSVLAKEVKRLATERSSPSYLATFLPSQITVRRVPTTARMQRIIPGYHFYSIQYTTRVRPSTSKIQSSSLGIPFESYMYAIDAKGQPYSCIFLGAKGDDFLNILQASHVHIHSASDAMQVWNLYLDLYENPDNYHRHLPPHQRSANIWDLNGVIGESQGDNGKPAFLKEGQRVTLNPDKTIASIRTMEIPVSGRGKH